LEIKFIRFIFYRVILMIRQPSYGTCAVSNDDLLKNFLEYIISHPFAPYFITLATNILVNRIFDLVTATLLITAFIDYQVINRPLVKNMNIADIDKLTEIIVKLSYERSKNSNKTVETKEIAKLFQRIMDNNAVSITRDTLTFNTNHMREFIIRSNHNLNVHTATSMKGRVQATITKSGYTSAIWTNLIPCFITGSSTVIDNFNYRTAHSISFNNGIIVERSAWIPDGIPEILGYNTGSIRTFSQECGICSICGFPIHIYYCLGIMNNGLFDIGSYTACGEVDHTLPPIMGNWAGSLVQTYTQTMDMVNLSNHPLIKYGMQNCHISCNQTKKQRTFLDDKLKRDQTIVDDFIRTLMDNIINNRNSTNKDGYNLDLQFLQSKINDGSFLPLIRSTMDKTFDDISNVFENTDFTINNIEVVHRLRTIIFCITTAEDTVKKGGSVVVMSGGAKLEDILGNNNDILQKWNNSMCMPPEPTVGFDPTSPLVFSGTSFGDNKNQHTKQFGQQLQQFGQQQQQFGQQPHQQQQHQPQWQQQQQHQPQHQPQYPPQQPTAAAWSATQYGQQQQYPPQQQQQQQYNPQQQQQQQYNPQQPQYNPQHHRQYYQHPTNPWETTKNPFLRRIPNTYYTNNNNDDDDNDDNDDGMKFGGAGFKKNKTKINRKTKSKIKGKRKVKKTKRNKKNKLNKKTKRKY
jgi:hypothetical protein